MRHLIVLTLATLVAILSPTTRAAGLPLVISATVDYAHNTLTITGQNFGSSAAVTLDGLAFPAQLPTSSSVIVANFPSSRAPGSFTPGTYFLTVTFKNQLPTVFAVDIGGSGAQGPAGPAGAPGATGPAGAQGATGPAGPAGPQGLVGPVGPPGATGATGAAGVNGAHGPQGITGPTGPQGLQGATGPQGPAGANGTGGGGLVCTTTPNVFLVTAANGAQTCQSRYMDNGNLTVTDNQTGLMWEKKIDPSVPIICSLGDASCPPDPHHNVDNTYLWSTEGAPNGTPNGTLFFDFLLTLNNQITPNGTSTCFAGYCDWRIPTFSELRTLQLVPYPSCPSSPCIDPIFGPTAAQPYWSSSAFLGIASYVYGIDFNNGIIGGYSVLFDQGHARAVRTSR